MPLSAPLIASEPPSACRVRSAVPVSMATAGSESEPPAISETGRLVPETRLVTARLSTSRTLTAPPESSRLPWKLLLGWASVMSPLPAPTVAVPEARIVPPVCRIGALVVVRPSVPRAVTSFASVIAPVDVRATLVPRRVPVVVRTPPLESVRLAVPVSMGAAGNVSTPPALTLTA